MSGVHCCAGCARRVLVVRQDSCTFHLLLLRWLVVCFLPQIHVNLVSERFESPCCDDLEFKILYVPGKFRIEILDTKHTFEKRLIPPGVKNFVQHGKAQLPEEEEIDPENMFANRRRAPPGPKREPGEGIATELPKNSQCKSLHVLSLLNLLQILISMISTQRVKIFRL